MERSDVLSFFIFLGPYDVKRATAQITSKEKSILEPRLMVFSKARVTARAALTRNWWFDTLVMVDWAWAAARDRYYDGGFCLWDEGWGRCVLISISSLDRFGIIKFCLTISKD